MSLCTIPSSATVSKGDNQLSDYQVPSSVPSFNEDVEEKAITILKELRSNSMANTGTTTTQKRKFASLTPQPSKEGQGDLSGGLQQSKKTFSDEESRIIVYFRDFVSPPESFDKIHQAYFSGNWTAEQIKNRYRNLHRDGYLKKLNQYKTEIKLLQEKSGKFI